MESQTVTPRNAAWSANRRAAEERKDERVTIPIVLPGKGQVGKLELPAFLEERDFDLIQGVLSAYRRAIVGEDG